MPTAESLSNNGPEEVMIVRREYANPMLPAIVRDQSKSHLSPTFAKDGSSNPHAPRFTLEEEKRFVWPLAKIHPDDRDKGDKIRHFWNSLHVSVPINGYVLNIKTYDDGTPVNPKHYVIYHWAKEHPLVASDRSSMMGNPHYRFYIHDPQVAQAKALKNIKAKREAVVRFDEILNDDKAYVMLGRVMRLLGTDPTGLDENQRILSVDAYVQGDPDIFLKVASDPDLATKSALLDMVALGILRREGNHFLFIDQPMGANLEQAVLWFKDKNNAATTVVLKERYKDMTKDRKAHLAMDPTADATDLTNQTVTVVD